MEKLARLVFVFVLLAASGARSQSTIGLPAIRNYTSAESHAGVQTWDIAQDSLGRLYFANDGGLLTYDGAHWQRYALPNKAAIRSLAIDKAGRVYVGGADEIGYFSPAANGSLAYHSLKERLPVIAQQFADIWNIVLYQGAVFFRTNEAIIRWKDGVMRVFDAPENWQLMTIADTCLFAVDKKLGVEVYRGGQWIVAASLPSPLHITGLVPFKKDCFLVTTLKNGLYVLNGGVLARRPVPADPLLENDLIGNVRVLGPDRFGIGTSTAGVLILDGEGRLVQQFSSSEGLQNNHVLRMMTDRAGDLWLGLQNGVSFVHYNTSVKLIRPMRNNQLVSNSVRIQNGRLYIGTSNGLYSLRLDPAIRDISTMKGGFTAVANTKGQVWGLSSIGGLLLAGHQDGAFVVRGDVAEPIMSSQGVWDFDSVWTGSLVAGTYTGLVWVHNTAGRLSEGKKVNRLYESLPVVANDGQGNVWASHPYRGVFRCPLLGTGDTLPEFSHCGIKQGLPSNSNDYLTVVRGKVVVGTERGVFEYDSAADRFKRSAFFEPIFGDTSVEYLRPDGDGEIWFVSQQRVGVIDFNKASAKGRYSVVYFPELKGQTVKGDALIYPYDKENIFIGSNEGVYHLNYSRYLETRGRVTVLMGVVKAIAEKDTVVFGGFGAAGSGAGGDGGVAGDGPEVRLPNHWNSFHFEYASPLYAPSEPVEFSYRLEGFDREWSDWTEKAEKDYTNLSYGEYTFSVRARDGLGTVSTPARFGLAVDPAWYQTGWAYGWYLAMALALAWLVRRRQRRRAEQLRKRYEAEQERRNYLHSLELDRIEKGLIALQNAKLEGELQFRNKELATAAMHLVERGGILSSIREELMDVIKRLNTPNLSFEFRSVFKMIGDTEKSDEDWNRFALYFDEVHNNYLTTLKTKFPQLSNTDLKLCAYLRLNLSSKEIAQLLNISLKGVEVSRYRLRKKLALATEVNLHDFLIEVTKGI
jgi:ligand-binding sensor domain-containing protein